MSYLWAPELSVGDVTIDKQHTGLLEKVNELHEAIEAGEDKAKIEEIVGFLGIYINAHLRYEEEYLEKHGYPELHEHKQLHKDFEAYYEIFKRKLELRADFSPLVTEAHDFMGKWFTDHIKIEDKKYDDHISTHPDSHPSGESGDYHVTVQA